MSISAGTSQTIRGKRITQSSSDEAQWLSLILKAIQNNGGLEASILAALGGAPTATIAHYDLLSAQTITLDSVSNYKAINIQVYKGSCTVSLDGGSTFITYPTGVSIGFGNNAPITNTVVITVSGTLSDGLNETFVQTII